MQAQALVAANAGLVFPLDAGAVSLVDIAV
jgi:hypothetical protein